MADNSKGTFENIKDRVGDTFENVKDSLTDTAKNIRNKVLGAKDTVYDAANDLRDSVVDTKNRATKKNLGDNLGKAYDSVKDTVKDNLGDVVEQGKDKAKEVIKEVKRKWEGASEKLEPLYNKGWEKLEMLLKNGEFNWEELKDVLGTKWEEFSEMMQKPGSDKDRGVVGRGKDLKLPEKLRDLYDLMWDKIDETFKGGKINFEDLKSVFFEKTDDLKELLDKALSPNKETKTFLDQEITRIKGLIGNWKEKFCDNCEHKKGLWESIKNLFSWDHKSSDKRGDRPLPPQPSTEKSTEL